MADVSDQIDGLAAQADAELSAVANSAQLEQFRIKFLGGKGAIKGLMKLLGQLPKDQKPAFGQKINALQDRVQSAFEARTAQLLRRRSQRNHRRHHRARHSPAHRQSPYPDEGRQRTDRAFRPDGLRPRLRAGSRRRIPQLHRAEYPTAAIRPAIRWIISISPPIPAKDNQPASIAKHPANSSSCARKPAPCRFA